MPATEARPRANRNNAQKSTNPLTEAGRARSRLDAPEPGVRSGVPSWVLPQEDPAELEARIAAWLEDCQPTNVVEHELVARGARASWALDRADRYEAALLSKRVRKAKLQSRTERTAKVGELGRKLLALNVRDSPRHRQSDDPAAIVAELEETPEGARWLLARWSEFHALIDAAQPWNFADQYRFVRLQGKQPWDAVDDPELNAVFLAWETIIEGWGVKFWTKMQDVAAHDDLAFHSWRRWRELAPRPAGPKAAMTMLRGVVDGEIERLEALAVELNAIDGEDVLELADRVSFADDAAGERLRRFQTARSRELIKVVETLARLRKETRAPGSRKAAIPPPEPSPVESAAAEALAEHQAETAINHSLVVERPRPAASVVPRSRPSRPRNDGRVVVDGFQIRLAASASNSDGRRRTTGSSLFRRPVPGRNPAPPSALPCPSIRRRVKPRPSPRLMGGRSRLHQGTPRVDWVPSNHGGRTTRITASA